MIIVLALKPEKPRVEIENGRLITHIQAHEQNRDDLKSMYEARLLDKNNLIS